MNIHFGLDLKTIQKNMFDRPHVRRALNNTQRYYLTAQGMNIRREARRSLMRGTPGMPQPGKLTKAGSGLAHILFHYDRAGRSVIVGPVLFPASQTWHEMTVPEVLEYGGHVSPNTKGVKRGIYTPQRIPELSYMRPAMEKALEREKQQAVWDAARRRAGT